VSDRGIYARPACLDSVPDADGLATGRTVLLVVPGNLFYLTPSEAFRLAEQLRGAVEEHRASAREEDSP